MKYSLTPVIAFIFLIAFPVTGKTRVDSDVAPCSGSVYIIGKSNIGNFILHYRFPEYICYPISEAENNSSTVNTILLPVRKFVAESEQMKEDFLSLVRAYEYPVIKLTFLNTQDLSIAKQVQQINVEISLAGVSRNYHVECTVEGESHTQICLKGSTTISIKDFNLEPPMKFFGLIRVKEDIDIDFSVNFTGSILTNTPLF